MVLYLTFAGTSPRKLCTLYIVGISWPMLFYEWKDFYPMSLEATLWTGMQLWASSVEMTEYKAKKKGVGASGPRAYSEGYTQSRQGDDGLVEGSTLCRGPHGFELGLDTAGKEMMVWSRVALFVGIPMVLLRWVSPVRREGESSGGFSHMDYCYFSHMTCHYFYHMACCYFFLLTGNGRKGSWLCSIVNQPYT